MTLGTKDNGGYPDDLMTDGNGANRRVMVEDASSTFFAGRQFRMFVEFDIPPNSALWVRHTITKNFILHDQRLVLESGAIRWSAVAAVAASPGPWTVRAMRRRNQMTKQPQPLFTSGSVIETSDTLAAATGGFEVDVMRIATANGGQSSSIEQNAGLRGLAPGVYHAKLFNPSAQNAVGVYDWWWEEID